MLSSAVLCTHQYKARYATSSGHELVACTYASQRLQARWCGHALHVHVLYAHVCISLTFNETYLNADQIVCRPVIP